jgi:MFS family permease
MSARSRPSCKRFPVLGEARPAAAQPRIALGPRENWQQFIFLVLINAFVGGMVGLERTLVPLIGSETFQLASTVAVTSFIVSFGVIKAITNLVSGQFADTWGRKKTLGLGWAVFREHFRRGNALPIQIAALHEGAIWVGG